MHREQLDRTRELLADARERSQERLVDINEPVELNLVCIIDGLHALPTRRPGMPPDSVGPLAAAARRRRNRALERAHAALRDLDRRGETIRFQAVARSAGVSRQWL